MNPAQPKNQKDHRPDLRQMILAVVRLRRSVGVVEMSFGQTVRELVLDDPAPFVPLPMSKRGKQVDYEAKR